MNQIVPCGTLILAIDGEDEDTQVNADDMRWDWSSLGNYSDSFLASSNYPDATHIAGVSYFKDCSVEWFLTSTSQKHQSLIGFSATGCTLAGCSIVFRKRDEQ
ncbi:hypothetical protein EYF88_02150 [Paracoccus sediminis]|uniref:Uncharacterized protein n=1 Tax=Paracoccus sediminis TaxID=1214787 RepID=A0ABY1YN93_9RHOB|nr:hypothetical protein [Paracoccus sediminis]TBN53026.1 hypothetical protein EYF88_02150 [Paracoccus sediminis]